MNISVVRLIISVIIIGSLSLGCSSGGSNSASGEKKSNDNLSNSIPKVEYTDCWFSTPHNPESVQCGYLSVPENRQRRDSRKIKLAFAILGSQQLDERPRKSQDPVIFLNGGPGRSTLENADSWWRYSWNFRFNRDFIIFDQRGVGFSQPALYCNENIYLERFLHKDLRLVEIMTPCIDRISELGIELSAYSTSESASDIEDLRVALGYEKVNLLGISYGTRLAMAVMNQHPDGIRSVILDSVAPIQVKHQDNYISNVEKAFDRYFNGCEQDVECNKAFPNVRSQFYELVDALNRQPRSIQLTINAVAHTIDVNGNDIIEVLFYALYADYFQPLLPIVIELALSNFSLLEPALQEILPAFLDKERSMGMTFAVDCYDSYPFYANSYQSAEGVFRMLTYPSEVVELCNQLQIRDTDTQSAEPIVSDIPTLILSGEYDPITPVWYGKLVAENLSNSFFFEFPNHAHGVSTGSSCGMSVAFDFLESPQDQPNDDCLDRIKPIDYVTDVLDLLNIYINMGF